MLIMVFKILYFTSESPGHCASKTLKNDPSVQRISYSFPLWLFLGVNRPFEIK